MFSLSISYCEFINSCIKLYRHNKNMDVFGIQAEAMNWYRWGVLVIYLSLESDMFNNTFTECRIP